MPSCDNTIAIDRITARRYLLHHQGLLLPNQYRGKSGIKKFIKKVGCIQFDPVNVIGHNPDLVLQARVKDYQTHLLHELLYRDYQLFDAWDKQASICIVEDWPYFERHRLRMLDSYWEKDTPEAKLAPSLLEKIRLNGHAHALKEYNGEYLKWNWGFPVRLERAALEILFAVRKLHVADRLGSRRIFDLTENLLPADLLSAPDPNPSLDDYQDWHVLRRIGGIGLVQPGSSEFWLGIQGMKTPERLRSIQRLLEKDLIIAVQIDDLPDRQFYMCRQDRTELRAVQKMEAFPAQVAFLPPLDNLLWDRKLLKLIFDFDYVWEIYKKPEQRLYGCYTMPVLLGDRFIARFEPLHDRKSNTLLIKNWWWEKEIEPDRKTKALVIAELGNFQKFLQADNLIFKPEAVL